jgi:hypothetical protein
MTFSMCFGLSGDEIAPFKAFKIAPEVPLFRAAVEEQFRHLYSLSLSCIARYSCCKTMLKASRRFVFWASCLCILNERRLKTPITELRLLNASLTGQKLSTPAGITNSSLHRGSEPRFPLAAVWSATDDVPRLQTHALFRLLVSFPNNVI